MAAVDFVISSACSPATVHHCSSSETLELMAAFTAMCLVPYLNYLYARWSGRDGVLRMGSGTVGGLTRKRTGGGGIDKVALAVMLVFIFKAGAGDGSKVGSFCIRIASLSCLLGSVGVASIGTVIFSHDFQM
uniref:Uncharacterized protein n=2 Tax=Triticum urartu TaxID=4572 RepID=A0A8R7TMQ2_TRIUA